MGGLSTRVKLITAASIFIFTVMFAMLWCQRSIISGKNGILNSIRREPRLEMNDSAPQEELPTKVTALARRLERSEKRVIETESALKLKASELQEKQLELDTQQTKFEKLQGRAKK